MENTETATTPFALSHDAVTRQEAEAAIAGAIVAQDAVGIIDVTGSGVVECLQGLLTSDIQGAGDGSFLYGALLTNKGMILCDMWTARHGSHAWLTIPIQGRDALFETFGRYLPPRLARATDHTDRMAVLRIAGPQALSVAAHGGIGVPEPGVSGSTVVGGVACTVSRPLESAPFGLQVQLERDSVSTVLEALTQAGAVVSDTPALDLARILAGWPRLGSEIGDKTLPQEVRFDEHNGVSYTKGCYTGQETVARVHFRGHVNKQLTGLLWDGTPDPSDPSIRQEDREVGQVTSVAWLAPFEQHIGLGIVRRIDASRVLTAAGAPALVTPLPFELEP
jgi:folate-binding protein YgfZ